MNKFHIPRIITLWKFQLVILFVLQQPSLGILQAAWKMSPIVILIRHAEALHNYTIRDPPLTEFGIITQCAVLSKSLRSFPLAKDIGLIVTSPMTRALQTAEHSLGWLMDRGVPAIARAEWQENTVNNIDIGRSVEELQKEFPGFDWSLMDPIFPQKEGLYEFSQEALTERGSVAKKWLKEREEKVVAVVSHDGFMRVGICQRKFGNADYRVFEFKDDGLELTEWDLTDKAGGGLGTSPKGHFGWLPNDFKYMPKKPTTVSQAID